jgi:hypothetical protein
MVVYDVFRKITLAFNVKMTSYCVQRHGGREEGSVLVPGKHLLIVKGMTAVPIALVKQYQVLFGI